MRITIQNRWGLIFLIVGNIIFGLHYRGIIKRISSLEDSILLLKNQNVCPAPSKENLRSEDNSFIDLELLNAVIIVESGHNPKAYNEITGAVGLLQLRPIVYKTICGLTKEQAFDPKINIACGSLYLKHLLIRFKGNLEKALLFYNNGEVTINEDYAKNVMAVAKSD